MTARRAGIKRNNQRGDFISASSFAIIYSASSGMVQDAPPEYLDNTMRVVNHHASEYFTPLDINKYHGDIHS